jgi:hypothetical protein
MCARRPASVASLIAFRSSMLSMKVWLPSWTPGSKSRGTAMSRTTTSPPVRRDATRAYRSRVTIGSEAPVVLRMMSARASASSSRSQGTASPP